MDYQTFYKEQRGKYTQFNFRNKHGESFILIMHRGVLYITGDETEWDVIPLFNRDFAIYSDEELKLLAKGLKNLATKSTRSLV